MHCCGGSHNREKEEIDDMDEIEKNIKKKEKMIKSHDHSCCGGNKGH